MKKLISLLRLFSLLMAALVMVPSLKSADYIFEAPLTTPKVERLDTTLSPTGGPVVVHLEFNYDVAGKIHCNSNSTLAGRTLSCRGTVTKTSRGVNYTFTLRSTNPPTETLTLTGTMASNSLPAAANLWVGPARAVYNGPKGRLNISTQQVTITATRPHQAQIITAPVISTRNAISGTGQVNVIYTTNPPRAGVLRGTVTTNRLSFTLTQSPRSVLFNGVRSNDVYVGTLTVNALPSRELIRNFRIPASAFPVRSGRAIFRGAISLASSNTPVVGAGVKVNVRSDLNGDGKITGIESKSMNADRNGRYQIPFTVQTDRPVVVEFVKSNYAQLSASYPVVSPAALIIKNVLLQRLSTMTVNSNRIAQTEDRKLALENLPPEVRNVQGRIFNPNTETSQFPGQFADNQQNLLISSVFSAVEAQDSRGRPVTNFTSDVTLCMEIPRDTWNTLGDMTNGTDRIDVPFYYYDEVSGEWKRNGSDGWLEDGNRVRIPESELGNIRNGSYSGKVCAVGPIRHLSYWNIDWPISTKASVQGVIIDSTGTNRADGALVTVKGITYTGNSSSDRMSPDGTFCVDIMRSENPGEDVDRDDVTGETQQVQVSVQWKGNYYTFGPFNSPVEQGTCGSPTSLSLGNLVLNEANKLSVVNCTVNGRVTYSGTASGGTTTLNPGDPIVGATVYVYDPEAPELFQNCPPTGCQFFTTTGADGRFTVTAPMLSGLSIVVQKQEASAQGFSSFTGVSSVSSCPQGDLNVSADFISYRFLIITMFNSLGEESTAVSINDLLSGSVEISGNPYFILSQTPRPRPTTTGAWVTAILFNQANQRGSITFTVTGLSPLQGTWSSTGPSSSGTWQEQE